MAAKAGVANRPRIPNDPPALYRVFCGTSQRVPCELGQLNSAAAYLLVRPSPFLLCPAVLSLLCLHH
jgi:hypothetical protein